VTDAPHWANILQGRHTLHLIPNADHNFFIPATSTTPRQNMNPRVAELISMWLGAEGESDRFAKRAEMIGHVKRWKDIEGVSNFRDLGAWQTKNTDYIKPDRIYRCADLSNITDLGRHALRQLNVCKVYDLRSVPEITKNGVGRIDGTEWIHVPVFREEDYSPEKMALRWGYYTSGLDGFVMAYTGILRNGGHPFGTILRHLRDSDDPIVIHCTAGKDRTGVICAIILKLLGCDDEVVAREYELTTLGLQRDHSKILAAVAHEGSNREAYNGDGSFKDGILNMLSSKYHLRRLSTDYRYEAMIQTLDMIRREYGSAEDYVKKVCGLSDDDLSKIRSRLLIKGEKGDKIGWTWSHVSRL
jgi:protein tyrosine/serine phosphatase